MLNPSFSEGSVIHLVLHVLVVSPRTSDRMLVKGYSGFGKEEVRHSWTQLTDMIERFDFNKKWLLCM